MESRLETEEDLQRLIGQYESIRLDFKASELLAQPKDRIIKQLTEDTSAFANTEGGVIVIGIREGKAGKKSIAVEIDDGVDPAQVSPEWLEQLISSNISPAIFGLTVRPVPLSGPKVGRVAYVVTIPKGTTAYQARHSLLYYGRTEFAAVPLPDNVIRLLMTRGQVAHATVEMAHLSKEPALVTLPTPKSGQILTKERRAALEAKRHFDEYGFGLLIRNDGPVTIRQCVLSVSVSAPFPVNFIDRGDPPWLLPFAAHNRMHKIDMGAGNEESYLSETLLFPEQALPFPGASFTARVPAGQEIIGFVLDWRLHLDNAPATSGSIDIARELRRTGESR